MKWVGPPQVAVFVPANSRAFFTANGGFLILFLFSLPSGRRDGVWRRISESSLSRYFPPRTGAKGEALKRNKTFCIILLSLNTFGKPSATMIIAVFFHYFNIFYRFPFGYYIFFVILERLLVKLLMFIPLWWLLRGWRRPMRSLPHAHAEPCIAGRGGGKRGTTYIKAFT